MSTMRKSRISSEIKNMLKEHYNRFKNKDFVVKPSFPILYFGNLERYSKSGIRVVTVGKNPSYWEFFDGCKYSTKLRFPKWNGDFERIEDTLNPYFETNPYTKWFGTYEYVLEGMGASYGGKYDDKQRFINIAIHTDICSPLATSPTWNDIEGGCKKELSKDGFKIWCELIESVLQPNIILISISKKECFSQLEKKYKLNNGEILKSFEETKDGKKRARPYKAYYYSANMNGVRAIIVYGPPAQTPFSSISNDQKYDLGKRIIEKYMECREKYKF